MIEFKILALVVAVVIAAFVILVDAWRDRSPKVQAERRKKERAKRQKLRLQGYYALVPNPVRERGAYRWTDSRYWR